MNTRKKTYLIKIYMIIQRLLWLLLLSGTLLIMIQLSLNYSLDAQLSLFQSLIDLQLTLLPNLQKLLLLNLTILSFLLVPEISNRLAKDSLSNLGKSVIGTLHFRRFLKQTQEASLFPLLETHHKTKNESLIHFNQAIRKSVLDVSNEQLTLLIPVPKEAQAQKILKEHEEQIKEHVSSLYPNYLISTFERNKFQLWLIGSKQG